MLTVGDRFPQWKARACQGLEQSDLGELSSAEYQGWWKIYIFYPKDFTFVCPTELVEFGKHVRDFEDRDAKIIGGSTDNEFSHMAWRRSHEDLQDLPYPLINAQNLARELDILEPEEGVCLRATFIVDPHDVIQSVDVNNLNVGRNVNEVLRVLDAIQSDELCPCNWQQGEETLQPA